MSTLIVSVSWSRSDDLDTARALLQDGYYIKAEKLTRALVIEAESTRPKNSRAIADALDVLVSVFIATRRNDPEVLDLARRAESLRREEPSRRSELAASTLNLSRAYQLLQMNDAAVQSAKESLALIDGDSSASSALMADCLEELSLHWARTGDCQQAQSAVGRSEAIRMAALGPRHPSIAATLITRGQIDVQCANYEGAQAQFKRALDIREETLRPGHPQIAMAWNTLGGIYTLLDEYSRAQHAYERTLAIYVSELPPGHQLIAWTCGSLATLMQRTGDYVAARDYYEKGIRSDEERIGRDQPSYLLKNYALLLHTMGELDSALAIQERILKAQKLLGDSSQSKDTMIAIGDLYLAKQDPRGAKSWYERACSLIEGQKGTERPEYANALSGLARIAADDGNFQTAGQLCQRAIGIRTTAYGSDHVPNAGLWELLGRIDESAGKPQLAMVHYAKGQRILDLKVGANAPQRASLLSAEARSLATMRRFDDALDSALKAEHVAQNHLVQTVRGLPERQALLYSASMDESHDIALSILLFPKMRTKQNQRDAFDAIIRSRAHVLDEIATRHHRMSLAKSEEAKAAVSELHAARQQVANLIVRGLDNPGQPGARLLAAARLREEQAEVRLTRLGFPVETHTSSRAIACDSVTNQLATDQALVSVVLFNRYDFDTNKPFGHSDPKSRYAAFVLRPTGSMAFHDLGDATVIDKLIVDWRDAILASAETPAVSSDDEKSITRSGQHLRAAIWDPIQQEVRTARLVFVVPDGAINLVNWAALNGENDRFLVDTGPTFHLISAERDLVHFGRRDPAPLSGGLLAVGGVDFDSTSSGHKSWTAEIEQANTEDLLASASDNALPPGSSFLRGPAGVWPDFSQVVFRDLPSTLGETRAIAKIWNESFHEKHRSLATSALRPAVLISGADASESEVKRLAPHAAVVHLATHGFFLSECSPQSADSMRGIAGYSVIPSDEPRSSNPFLLSGLALAGANRRRVGGEDGILTAEEITLLDLSNVQWAVLSACDTGVGAIRAGEGIIGLRRSLHVAGARTLITSLWPVPDLATRTWMESLYAARFERQMTTAEAVREATKAALSLRRENKESTNPCFWGGFVAEGDWQ